MNSKQAGSGFQGTGGTGWRPSNVSRAVAARIAAAAGRLKRVDRAGWRMRGVEPCESVAEHSFRAAVLAHLVALDETRRGRAIDPGQAALRALYHDLPEAVLGDIPRPGGRFLPEGAKRQAEESIFRELSGADPELAPLLHGEDPGPGAPVIDRLVAAVDYAEMVLQAKEYTASGRGELDDFLAPPPLDHPVYDFSLLRDLLDLPEPPAHEAPRAKSAGSSATRSESSAMRNESNATRNETTRTTTTKKQETQDETRTRGRHVRRDDKGQSPKETGRHRRV